MLGRIRGMLGPHTNPSKNDWLLLPGGHAIEVAGVLRHQKAVARVAANRSAEDDQPALTATLIRVAANPKDPDAVAVAVALVIPGEKEALLVGNLTRDLAPAMGAILRRLEQYGFRGAACHATLTEGGRRAKDQGVLGVELDLGSRSKVEEYIAAVRKDPRSQPVEFEEDPESAEFKAQAGWRVPGWVE
jgi:hypothetical protein